MYRWGHIDLLTEGGGIKPSTSYIRLGELYKALVPTTVPNMGTILSISGYAKWAG